ncbi:MAG: NIPSNAP family protein [Alphaproteobacteria bacterium]|nr:NIPSNAP family protein [Alphaproteobacteria bacterium]
MIYQHRLVIARGGKLEQRHEHFQNVALQALDDHGSTLVGAWEIWIGVDAGCALWQLREHESLATWEQHRERAMADTALRTGQDKGLYPTLDFVDTAILRLTDFSPEFPPHWPDLDAVRGQPRAFIEQRVLTLKPGTAAAHHAVYADKIMPALARDGASLIGFFDTVIGPGTTNTGSHRSVEIRSFPDLACWQNWREAQDNDAELSQLVKRAWLETVDRVESTLLRPMDYSRIR